MGKPAPTVAIKYEEGEIVLATDKGKQYEAKILKRQKCGASFKYFIHFQQWSKKYDTWIDPSLLESRKVNDIEVSRKSGKPIEPADIAEDNNEQQSQTEKESPSRSRSRNSASSSSSSSATSVPVGISAMKRQRKEMALQDLAEEDNEDTMKARIPLPSQLKRQLVDEWTQITSDPKKLLCLPKATEKTVASLVKDFQISKGEEDAALPTILLYRHERDQYDRVAAALPTVPPSRIYGGEHFLRLFVRITKLLSQCVLPAQDLNFIISKFNDLIKFIQKNADKYLELNQYKLVDEVMTMPVEMPPEPAAEDASANSSAKKKQRTRR